MKFATRVFAIFKKTETYVVSVLLVALLFVGYLNYSSPRSAYPEAYYGKPVVSQEYPQINLSIEQVVEVGQYLYVLHHHSNGIVQVYDLSGTYQHTLFFYCHEKGGFSLAADDQFVYVQDMRNHVYVLMDGAFISFLERAEAERQLNDIDFRSGASSAGYEIRSNGVWRISESSEQCIIESAVPNRYLADIFLIVICAGFALVMLFQYRKRN